MASLILLPSLWPFPRQARTPFLRPHPPGWWASDGLQLSREAIELALEGTAEGFDALRRPGGQVGEGPRADLVPIAEGFTQEDGGRRVAIGNGCDIHECLYIKHWAIRKEEIRHLHDYAIERKIA